jgi:hypothetical protein
MLDHLADPLAVEKHLPAVVERAQQLRARPHRRARPGGRALHRHPRSPVRRPGGLERGRKISYSM